MSCRSRYYCCRKRQCDIGGGNDTNNDSDKVALSLNN